MSSGRLVTSPLPASLRYRGASQGTLRNALAAVSLPYNVETVQALADAGLLHLEASGLVRIDPLETGGPAIDVPEVPALCPLEAVGPDYHQLAEDPGRGAGGALQELLAELGAARPGVLVPELGGVP